MKSLKSLKPIKPVPLPSFSTFDVHPLLETYYKPLELIGSGGYGSVIKVARRDDGEILAVKLIPRDRLPQNRLIKVKFSGDDLAPGIRAYGDGVAYVPVEAYVLRRVVYDGVVAFVDIFEDPDYFYLVMEYHGTAWRGGEKIAPPVIKSTSSSSPPPSPFSSPTFLRSSSDLYQCLEEHRRLPEEWAKFVFRQMIDAVETLLQHGVVHCDIKDQNFVIDDQFKVKMVDFGAAAVFDPETCQAPLLNGLVGTRRFAAPEVLAGEWYDPVIADVWSLGILLATLLTGDLPFASEEDARSGVPPIPRSKISREARSLMMRCLDVDVESRIRVDEIRHHPWLWSSGPRA